MTPALLAEIGRALYGREWQTQLAEAIKAPLKPAIGVNIRRVQRWQSGKMPIPDWVGPELHRQLELRGMDIRHLLGGVGEGEGSGVGRGANRKSPPAREGRRA